jgi:hypothetical protein
MGQIVVNVGSFDLTSHNGNTAYSSQRYFTVPANAGITKCVATFATHVNTGDFQGKSFSLNSVQAHPNTPWPTSGIAINPALLSAGRNAFRAAVKSQAGLSARWSIGDIYLTIDYTDAAGPGGQPYIGELSIDKTVLTAGDTLSISVSACDAGITRSLYLMLADNTVISYIYIGWGSNANVWAVEIPADLFTSFADDTDSLILRVYMEAAQGATLINALAKNFTANIPSSAVPTIGTFTATLNKNGVDASITGYVQNYSKVNLAIGGEAGVLGSSVASYEITGGGFSAASLEATFGPFSQAGDITFLAKVTDTRGRTATRTVTINVLSYGPASFSNPEAWRSSDVGVKSQKGTYARLKSGVSYSSLNGQNSVTLKGRMYPKGGTVPAYTSMTPDTEWITGGGLLLATKTYIAQMEVADLIGSRTIEFTIPTKKTGISIMAGMAGIAFGKSAEIPGYAEFGWPIYNCPYEVGDILQTLSTSSPEDRWPGTEWESIAGRVLVGIDSTQTEFDTVGEEGGEKTHTLTQAELPDIPANPSVPTICSTPNNTGGPIVDYHILGSQTTSGYSVPGIGADLGSGEAHNNLQPYKVVYMWLRTA